MSKLSTSDKEKIIEELIKVFKIYDAEKYVFFYYDNIRARFNSETRRLIREEGINPRDYLEFCNENTISVTFEGSPLYQILNGYVSGNLYKELNQEILDVVDPYGLYYELGHAWSLSFYFNEDNKPEPKISSIHNKYCRNRNRAFNAEVALHAYANKAKVVNKPFDIWIIDLLGDIIHLCDRDKLNFEEILQTAREHYQNDADHEDENCGEDEEEEDDEPEGE